MTTSLQLLNVDREVLLEVAVHLSVLPDGCTCITPLFPFQAPAGTTHAQLCVDGQPVGGGEVAPAADPVTDAIDARLAQVFGALVDKFNTAGVTAQPPGVSGPLSIDQQ